MTIIGQKLEKIRKDAGLNQKELAALLKRSSSYISRIESGEREPTPAFIKDFLKVCKSQNVWTETEFQEHSNDIQEKLRQSALDDIENLHQKNSFGEYAGVYYWYSYPSVGINCISQYLRQN
jgi:transcriptional regulator with XRE-family HTH domain